MVGTELNLRIRQAPDAVVGGRTIRVFQYAANVEDKVCSFRSVVNYGFFQRTSAKFYNCHGEVWTDESGFILRISEAIDLSGPWYRWQGVMTYAWLEKEGVQYLSRSPSRPKLSTVRRIGAGGCSRTTRCSG